MKRAITIVSLLLLFSNNLFAFAGIVGKNEMVAQSELIAIVDILELVAAEKGNNLDLFATGFVDRVLKGNAKKDIIKFRIHRFFPCAALDVSSGRHLVFLKKNNRNEYVGVNWYMSYLYLSAKTITWFDDKGKADETKTPLEVIQDVEALIKESANETN